jgi:phosphoribosylformylglycinamidine synthase
LLDPAAMARLSVGEALTNIVWARISALEDIKCSGNWMWAAKLPGEGAKLYDAVVALSDVLIKLGIAIDGGKDSLSMAAQVRSASGKTETVKSPGTLVISAYATMPDITKVITPDIKKPGKSKLIYINLGKEKGRLGGSALAHVCGQIGNECPDMEDPGLLKRAFNVTQEMISKNLILAGHDISDGGLITTLLEMAFAGNCGFISHLNCYEEQAWRKLFAEELGKVIEYEDGKESEIISLLEENKIPFQLIGITTVEKEIVVWANNHDGAENVTFLKTVLKEDMRILRGEWEETSYQLERLQASPDCAEEEKVNIFDRAGMKFNLSFAPELTLAKFMEEVKKPKVAIIREEGSNGDREMASAFYQAGFEPHDVTMTDFIAGRISLAGFRGIAFVGGFSYADVLDSAKGWAGAIRFNEEVRKEFQNFYNRPDTFSLSVCNGCQLAALLGWIPWQGIEMKDQPRFIHNESGRFESRFSSVKILPSKAIMFKDMEGSALGVWVAHGEGRAHFPSEEIYQEVIGQNLAPARYVDDEGDITESYPNNPNGSVAGIAALCSPDGRHLAIMPHPERTFLKWQWPWMPEDWKENLKASPWLKMFQNAREWCEKTK